MDLNCRVCLQLGNIMISIFEQVDKYEMTLCNLLEIFGGLTIDVNDDFPKYLCEKCTQELFLAAEFRKKFKKSQELLIKMKPNKNNEGDFKNTTDINTDESIMEEIFNDSNEENLENTLDLETCADEHNESDEMDSTQLQNEIEELEKELIGTESNEQTYSVSSLQEQTYLQGREKTKEKALKIFCKACKSIFDNEKLFKQHICSKNLKNSTNVCQQQKFSSKTFTCQFCDKKLSTAFRFKLHVNIHSGDLPFECNLCENKFKSRPALVSHKNMHKNQKLVNLHGLSRWN